MLPLFILVTAFVTGIVLLVIPENKQKIRTTINLVNAFLTILMIVILIIGINSGQEFRLVFPLLPNINLVLHADPLSLMFVGLSGVLWFVTTIYAIGYLRKAKHQSRFFGFFSLCVFATLGIAMAGNLITFLIFYELLTLAAYPLIVHKGNEASLRAGRIYLRYTMIGGAVLLVGVVWLKSLAGALDFSAAGDLANMTHLPTTELTIIFVLLIVGLGVKAALVPLHGWLPEAMAAPAPVSSLLHAVAVVKAGAFGIIRVIYDVYGFEFADSLGVLFYLSIAASITIIYASIRALYQDDLKKRLAYSTVSQVSYIALGASIGGPLAAIAAVTHLVHQGIMKITMFFSAGNFAEELHIHKVSELDGVGSRMPLTMTALTLAIFGMIGIPPIAGFVTKWYLGNGAILQGQYWVLVVLALSSLLNAMYLLPIIYRGWFKPSQGEWPAKSESSKLEVYWMLLIPPLITVTLSVLAGLFAASEFSPLKWAKVIASQEFVNVPSLINTYVESSSLVPWLIVLTPMLFAGVLFLSRHKRVLIACAPICALPAIFFAFTGIDYASSSSFLFFSNELLLDKTTQLFLMLAGVLWFLATLYAQFYMAKDPKQSIFTIFMLLAMSGCFGLTLSQDPYGFITFFTLMSLSSFVLVIHQLSEEAREASRSYIRWVIIGEVLLFSGFCLSQWYAGFALNSQLAWITSLIVVLGFGSKVGLFGMHWWLPKAHPVAPVPASAILSGFMVKAGVIGWLRFVPQSVEPLEIIGYLLVGLGVAGTFLGATKGMFQHNPKVVLAYSTVSQMGILTMAFGATFILTDNRDAIISAMILYCIHHGLAKSALFFSVGIAPLLALKSQTRYFAYFVIIMPALALVGMPFLSGGYAKLLLKEQLIGMPILPTLISISSLFTGLLMYRFTNLMSRDAGHHYEPQKHIPLLLICLLTVLLMILWPFISFETIRLSMDNILAACWPVVVAICTGLLLTKFVDKYVNKASNADLKRTTSLNIIGTYFSSLIMSVSRIMATAAQRKQSLDTKFIILTINRISTNNSVHLSFVVLTVLLLAFVALIVV
jgi:multicomponent Na+:H+ antiporter subunit D